MRMSTSTMQRNTPLISYIDTRNVSDQPIPFSKAILRGLAPGGGLYVPEHIPHFSAEDLKELASMPYWQAASHIFQAFGVDFDAEQIDRCMKNAYGNQFDTPDICHVVPFGQTEHASGQENVPSSADSSPSTNILELWHGPTSAFKDMALQCLPQFFSAAIEKYRAQNKLDHDYLILVATSGDTGGAALSGFADVPHVKIVVMYPQHGVSDIQHAQMTTQEGSNVMVWALRGNFDTCQSIEKKIFGDPDFRSNLLTAHGYTLSSANSINWGRLLPQIVYYLIACGRLLTQSDRSQAAHVYDSSRDHDVHVYSTGTHEHRDVDDTLFDVCVPTGNFGDILAAWYAKHAGAPIDRLLCASNENRVLADFIHTGTYDISNRPFKQTPSPAMDILISSNLERLLFELTGHDGKRVATWMDELAHAKKFTIDKTTFVQLRKEFSADFASNDECLSTIRDVYRSHHYLVDPHTAVAINVAQRIWSDRPLLIASTAHWAKFGKNVYKGLHGIADASPLPRDIDALSGYALNDLIKKQTGSDIPRGLQNLQNKPVRFHQTFDASAQQIEDAISQFVSSSAQ